MQVDNLHRTYCALEADCYELDQATAQCDSPGDWRAAEMLAMATADGWHDLAERQMWALHEFRDHRETRLRLEAQIRHSHDRRQWCLDTAATCRAHAELARLKRSPMERAYDSFLAGEATEGVLQ